MNKHEYINEPSIFALNDLQNKLMKLIWVVFIVASKQELW